MSLARATPCTQGDHHGGHAQPAAEGVQDFIGAVGNVIRCHALAQDVRQQHGKLGFVGRDHVAQGKQSGIKARMHRRRIEHAQKAMSIAQCQRDLHCIQIVFQLHKQHARGGECAFVFCNERRAHPFIGGQVDHDLVGAFGIDDDACRGRGDIIENLPCAIQSFPCGIFARRATQAIVANGAQVKHIAALAETGNGLVESLAAGAGAECQCTTGLAWLREAVGRPDMILHIAAEHDGEVRAPVLIAGITHDCNPCVATACRLLAGTPLP